MTRQDEPQPDVRMFAQLDRIAKQLKALAHVQEALHQLYTSLLGQDVGLKAVLRQVVVNAMDLTKARYGALGVLSEHGDHLVDFVPVGLNEEEEAVAAALGPPRGRGLLGHLMTSPRPLRVGSVSEHAMAVGLPPGHPPVHTLLGVAINSRGQTYGNLYVSNRRDGRPFDEHDEAMIVVLADAAALAIDDARLLGQVREAEEFQRQLRPQLPDLQPIKAAGLSRPAAAAGSSVIGGDWYDAIRLSDDSSAVAIGDTGGHGLRAAAGMTQTRSMLRTLLYEQHRSPSVLLSQLDHRLQATPDIPVTTALLARLRPAASGWRLRWSTAGHPAPLLLLPGEAPRYLDAEPGLPLGIDPDATRADLQQQLPGRATLVFFTDGLVEHHKHPLDERLATLARLGAQNASQPPERLCQALLDNHPGDGSDDIAILTLQLPPDRTQ